MSIHESVISSILTMYESNYNPEKAKLELALKALEEIACFTHKEGCLACVPLYETCCVDKLPPEMAREALEQIDKC